MTTPLAAMLQIKIFSQDGISLATTGADCTVMPSDTVSGSMITSDAESATTRLKALPTWVASVTVPDSWWLSASHDSPGGSDDASTDQVKSLRAPWATRFCVKAVPTTTGISTVGARLIASHLVTGMSNCNA